MTRASELKAKAERARDRFEGGRKQLFRSDGEKLFSEDEHSERLASLRRERNAVLDEIQVEADSSFKAATEEIAVLEHGGLTARLSTDELEQASARHALMAADVASLDRDELKERLAAVMRGGDRATQACYWLAARGKVSGGEDVGMLEVLEGLDEAITPDSHRRKIEAARRSLEEVSGAKEVAYLARREQSSVYAPSYNVPGR